MTVRNQHSLTAPVLLGMQSRAATVLAAFLCVAVVISATADITAVRSVPLFIAGLVIAMVGVLVVVRSRSDLMARQAAICVAASGPIAVGLTCLAIPGPLDNPSQFNALGAGVAICAFLCVRGRTLIAWCGFVAMVGIATWWSLSTDQGLAGLVLSVPNGAVIAMSTLFAMVVRPAALTIRELNDVAIAQARQVAVAAARIEEADERRAVLRGLVGSVLRSIAARVRFSPTEALEARLLEAQLRDSIRAKSLDVPTVVAAARNARARGVPVTMLDDGALDAAPVAVRHAFCGLVASQLENVACGSLTVRVHPPGRDVAASIVAVHDDGASRRFNMDVLGVIDEL